MSNCSWISFNFKKSDSFKYILGYWFFEKAFRIAMYLNWDYFQLSNDNADNEYYYVIFLVLSDSISFIGLCISNKNKEKVQQNSISDSGVNRTQKNINEIILFIIIIFIFDFFARCSFYFSYKVIEIDNEPVSQKLSRDSIILIDTICRIFLFVLCNIGKDKYKNFNKKRWVFCILAILIILGVLIIIDVIHMIVIENYAISKCLKYFGVLLPRSLLYPIVDAITNITMKKDILAPIGYIRYRFVIELIIGSIITSILYFTAYIHFSIETFESKFFIIGVIYILVSYAKSYILMNVIYYYSLQFVPFLTISESFAGSIHEIITLFNNKENFSKPINIIISSIEIILVLLIGIVVLIFEEICVIKIWSLNEELVDDINQRGVNDSNMTDLKQDFGETA